MERKQKKLRRSFEEKAKGVFAVEGQNAVMEYLRYSPESIEFVVYKKNIIKNSDVLDALKKKGIKAIEAASYNEEDFGLYGKAPLWAGVRVQVKGEEEVDNICTETGVTLLVLDHITDPRNLGAIMRTAAFFGVTHVLAAKDRQVLLTQSSVATAQGAFALSSLIAVTNLARAIKRLKQHGFWVIGTAPGGTSINDLNMIDEQDNLALIMGSEEKGMSRLISGLCDWTVSIEGAESTLNSLNVSVATGIVIDRILQKRKKPVEGT